MSRSGERILTRKQKEWAYDKWCEGHTQDQIADALCVCPQTIRRALQGKPRIRPILEYDFAEELRGRTKKGEEA